MAVRSRAKKSGATIEEFDIFVDGKTRHVKVFRHPKGDIAYSITEGDRPICTHRFTSPSRAKEEVEKLMLLYGHDEEFESAIKIDEVVEYEKEEDDGEEE